MNELTFRGDGAELWARQLEESGAKIGIVGDFKGPHFVDCITRHLSLQVVHAFEEEKCVKLALLENLITYSLRTPLLNGVATSLGCDIGYSCLLLFGTGKGNSGWQCGPIGLQGNVQRIII